MWNKFSERMPDFGRLLMVIDLEEEDDIFVASVFPAYILRGGFGNAIFKTDGGRKRRDALSHHTHMGLMERGKWAYVHDIVVDANPGIPIAIPGEEDLPTEAY